MREIEEIAELLERAEDAGEIPYGLNKKATYICDALDDPVQARQIVATVRGKVDAFMSANL